jgi:hypothetical protein
VIALNLGAEPLRFELPSGGGQVLLSTNLDREGEPTKGPVELRGNEGLVVELRNTAFSIPKPLLPPKIEDEDEFEDDNKALSLPPWPPR